jgi:hypothetical protein
MVQRGIGAPGAWVDGVLPVNNPPVSKAINLPSPCRAIIPRMRSGPADPDQRLVYNVGKPQLLLWPGTLPAGKVAPAIILVPGGGFQFLAMDNEGFDVAKRLDKQGVQVFILKYRTLPVGEVCRVQRGDFGHVSKRRKVTSDNVPYAVADTQAAIRMVAPRRRIGMLMRRKSAFWAFPPGR